MTIDPTEFNIKPIGAAGLEERTSLDGSERILVQAGADTDVNTTPMQFFRWSIIKNLSSQLRSEIDALLAEKLNSSAVVEAFQATPDNNHVPSEKLVADQFALSMPSGIIVMWSGLISAIPTGWFLCDGLNGTPDLRARFVYGASIDADVKTTGGSANAIVVSHTHTGPAHTHTSAKHTHSTPNHTHSASSNSTGAHTHTFRLGGNFVSGGKYNSGWSHGEGSPSTSSAGAHSHTITVNSGGASTTGSTTPGATGSSGTGATGSTGSSGTNANLPPYMKLAYIMKG